MCAGPLHCRARNTYSTRNYDPPRLPKGGLPVVFVRFNPDTFCTGSKSARVKVSAESIPKRHAAVVAAVGHAVANVAQGLTFVKLYFDCSCIASSSSSSSDHPCGFSHTTTYKDHEAFLMDFQ
mmetsp:Transcript_67946/g.156260  ORF Transcript_67946/g.156260 Transcript_67946/m.156260 type:complete len:123 (-) Transcript_67946:330-698(-)